MSDLEHVSKPIKRVLKKIRRHVVVPDERYEQEMTVAWARRMSVKEPRLKLLFAIPNGAVAGRGRWQVVNWMKKMGMQNGVPDLFLPVTHPPAKDACGLWIEMKRRNHDGSLSVEQRWWHDELRMQGYFTITCAGADQAIASLQYYLGMK